MFYVKVRRLSPIYLTNPEQICQL